MSSSTEKGDSMGIEHREKTETEVALDGISVNHRNFLLKHHGTTQLDPIPSMDLADPLNWPSWKKNINLMVVASLSFMTVFMAAGISPAFVLLAADLNVTVSAATYLTSSAILAHGLAPLFWRPISNLYGRRPVWLVSTLGACVFNIACAKSLSYAAQQVFRILTTFFISASVGIGSVVVTETFFAQQRATKMGFWTLGTTLGPFAGPFLIGFVVNRTRSWEWIYWIFAIANGVQFILVLFLCPETRFPARDLAQEHLVTETRSTFEIQYMTFFSPLTSQSLSFKQFYSPLELFAFLKVIVPVVACSIVFNFASVFFTVELPPLFQERFEFNPEESGLQFLSLIIGSVIGEVVGGPLSDLWMARRATSLGQRATPEDRLWLSHIGFAAAIAGFLTFGIRLQEIGHSYSISPIIGMGMAGFGNQLITTVLVTYAVDSNPTHAASVGVLFNVVRSTWGWLGPFWFLPMVKSIGLAGSSGVMAGLTVGAAVLPILLLQWKGSCIRDPLLAT